MRDIWEDGQGLQNFSAKPGREVSVYKLNVVWRIILKSMLRKYLVE
jgi:hypothetical protein